MYTRKNVTSIEFTLSPIIMKMENRSLEDESGLQNGRFLLFLPCPHGSVENGVLVFCLQMCQGLNSHYFHVIGDKLINLIIGVYIPIMRIPIKGGRSPIPNIVTFDHGTNGLFSTKP